MNRLVCVWTLVAPLLAWAHGNASAQERIAVFSEPGTPVIATELLLAVGPADEPEGMAGIAYLAARTVTRPIIPALDSLDARLELQVHKDALGFTLIAAPDAWGDAARVLLVALFRDPVDRGAFTAEQSAIAGELMARRTNPADAAVREVDLAFFGPEHPWGRPAVGEPESIRSLTAPDVDAFLRTQFTPDRAFAAVVGPADTAAARAHLLGYIGAGGPDRDLPPEPGARDSTVRREYNSITTWVAAAFPFPASSDVESLRLLAQMVEDELSFGPTRQSVFDVRAEVIPRVAGGELRVTVVIPPAEAGAWADRIGQVVTRVADPHTLPVALPGKLRRYRGERLQSLSAPEDRAREAARRLFTTGAVPRIVPDFDLLSAERLTAASRSLGEPTIVFLGPFLDDAP